MGISAGGLVKKNLAKKEAEKPTVFKNYEEAVRALRAHEAANSRVFEEHQTLLDRLAQADVLLKDHARKLAEKYERGNTTPYVGDFVEVVVQVKYSAEDYDPDLFTAALPEEAGDYLIVKKMAVDVEKIRREGDDSVRAALEAATIPPKRLTPAVSIKPRSR